MRPAGGSKLWPLPEGISGAAAFSDDGEYRYVLSRSWSDELPIRFAAFIGLNPSTAEAHLDDPTVRKSWKWAQRWGFDGIYMLNLYSYRATSPDDMRAAADPVGRMNDRWISNTVEGAEVTAVIPCWGAGAKLVRAEQVMRLLPAEKLHCLGLTKDGHPKHPLYLPNTTELQRWVAKCALCGSSDIFFDMADGYGCRSCGRSDADA